MVTGTSLTGADLQDWMALRRVSDGGVTMLGECWLEGGHRLPGYITEALTALCQRGLATLTAANPEAWPERYSPRTEPPATSTSARRPWGHPVGPSVPDG